MLWTFIIKIYSDMYFTDVLVAISRFIWLCCCTMICLMLYASRISCLPRKMKHINEITSPKIRPTYIVTGYYFFNNIFNTWLFFICTSQRIYIFIICTHSDKKVVKILTSLNTHRWFQSYNYQLSHVSVDCLSSSRMVPRPSKQ